MDLPAQLIDRIVAQALQEDIGDGDRTTLLLIDATAFAEAQIVTREPCVIAGLPVFQAVYNQVDPELTIDVLVKDGDTIEWGAAVAELRGSARSILTGERVALNFLQRLCGIATQTRRYVEAIGDLPTRLLDTRKTTPGLRALEKYAVRVGGGFNHRFGLYDAVMIKDNHLAVLEGQGVSLAEAVRRARQAVGPLMQVEVEVETVAQACEVAEAGASLILLDNMPPDELREAVQAVAGRAQLEASGGITLETIRAVAETGVDYISSGALTYAARAIDLSLELDTI